MNLSVNFTTNNVIFGSRLTKFSKEQMDRVLLPIFEGDAVDIKLASLKSGYTQNAIQKWFKETFGESIAKFFLSRRKNALKAEMEDFYKRGVPIKEVAKYYDRSITWVNNRYVEFGFKHNRVHIDDGEKDQILEHIKAGYIIKDIAEKFHHSETTIQKLINLNLKEGLVKYRHDNNILILRKQNKTELERVEKIKKCFEEGKSLKETAKFLGETCQKILYMQEKYNIKSGLDIAHERMEKLLPKFVEMRMKIKTMAEEIGLSAQTIRRRIKELYGKTYLDIRMGR